METYSPEQKANLSGVIDNPSFGNMNPETPHLHFPPQEYRAVQSLSANEFSLQNPTDTYQQIEGIGIDLSYIQSSAENPDTFTQESPSINIALDANVSAIDIYAPPSLHHTSLDESHPSYVPPVQNDVLFSSFKIFNQKDMAKNTHIPFGMIYHPLCSLQPLPPCLRKPPVKCAKCKAIINRYCKVELSTGTWECIFCRTSNNNKEEYGDSGENTAIYPELVKMTVEYLDPSFQQSIPVGASQIDPIHIFVIDLCIPTKDLQNLKEAILSSLSSLDRFTRIGLITFSNVISVYQLNCNYQASAVVLPGIVSPSSESMALILERLNTFLSPIIDVETTLPFVLDTIISSTLRRASSNQRCFGSAIETALLMQGADEATPSRADIRLLSAGSVIAFLSGSPNFGPGAVSDDQFAQGQELQQDSAYLSSQALSYFKSVGTRAHLHNVNIDVICGGLKQFHTAVLQNLVLPNGGIVMMQKDFSPVDLSDNLRIAMNRTCGSDGTFEIHHSEPINITHIIGPAVSVQYNQHDQDQESSSSATSNLCRMAAVQPRSSFALYYELSSDIVEDFVYFQFVVSFTNRKGQRVIRVTTRKLPTTGNMQTFLTSVDSDVVSVLAAKRIVLKARKSENIDPVLAELDQTLSDIVSNCGSRTNKRSYVLPQELSSLPRKFFLLRRGPLLGPILQHLDDIDFLRCLFLNASFEDCKRIIEPPLTMVYSDNPNASDEELFCQVPLEDLALQSDKILVLDHQTDIFIWIGRGVAARIQKSAENPSDQTIQILDRCWGQVKESAKFRFPKPNILQFKEGSSMARWLQCRLIPSHKDSPDEQLSSFPQLEELPPDQRMKLVSKFHRTDDLSLNQYYRGLFN